MSPAPNGSRRALVTGARGQLGTALTKGLSDAGWTVLAGARPGPGDETAPGDAGLVALDLREDDQIERAAAELLTGASKGDQLALVCNATAREPARAWMEASRDDFHQLYDVDVVGHFLLARAVATGAIEAGASASIVFIASIYAVGGYHPGIYPDGMKQGSPQYASAKGALVALARDLAGRWGRDGVRVNAVVPGGISGDQPSEFVTAFEELTQLGRMAEPEEVAEMVEMLASERASYVTGQAIGVDGGWTAW